MGLDISDLEQQSVEALRRDLDAAHLRIAELERLIELDPLTGVLNRRGFDRAIAQVQCRADRYQEESSILYVDLDGFKQINDRLGHDAGDRVLREIAAMLVENCRSSDVVARVGGDEFVVILMHADQHVAAGHAKRLAQRVLERQIAAAEGHNITVSISVGIAPIDRASISESLKQAERSMYRRKARSRSAALDDAERPRRRPRRNVRPRFEASMPAGGVRELG